MSTDRMVPIVLITADGSPTKVTNNHAGKYVLLVDYHLEDGVVQQSAQYFRLLRDAKAYADTLPAAPEYEMMALYTDTGEYIGTRTRVRLSVG